LNPATAVIAGDGLSFTHASLTAGDGVYVVYEYVATNTYNANTTVYYYDNPFVGASPDGTVYRAVLTFANGGTVTVGSVAI